MADRVARVVMIGDDPAAMGMVRLMHMSWLRGATALQGRGLRVEWQIPEGGLDAFHLPRTDPMTPFIEDVSLGEIAGRKTLTRDKAIKGRMHLTLKFVPRRLLNPPQEIEVQLRMVAPEHLAAERPPVDLVASLLRDNEPGETAATEFVLLGITDASLEWRGSRENGSGVDQIMNPGILTHLLDAFRGNELRLAVAITGLERDFARFDGRDQRWSAYGNAYEAAWRPEVIKPALHAILADRPHLRDLMLNYRAFRISKRWPLAFTAVMPCGFLRDWNHINYNPSEPGWIEGSPAIRGERDAAYFDPYCCADPLLTALTGISSPLQVTADEADVLRRFAPRRVGAARGLSLMSLGGR